MFILAASRPVYSHHPFTTIGPFPFWLCKAPLKLGSNHCSFWIHVSQKNDLLWLSFPSPLPSPIMYPRIICFSINPGLFQTLVTLENDLPDSFLFI